MSGRMNANHIYKKFAGKSFPFQEDGPAEREEIIRAMYVRILLELATNRFQWHGLPDSINKRFLELTLATKGMSVFFYDETYNQFMALQGTTWNVMNIVDEPVKLRITGRSNYKSKTLSAVQMGSPTTGEAVPIWSNYLRTPDWDIIQIYAHKLAQVDTTIEINMRNARRSRILVADENQRLTMENISREIDEGNPIVKVNDINLALQVQAFDLGVEPNTIEKLHIVKVRLWNECMGLLGINSANQDKKERMVTDEVTANDEQISTTQAVNLNARRQACDMINKRWPEKLMGLNGPVSVEIGGTAEAGVPAPSTAGLHDVGGLDNV